MTTSTVKFLLVDDLESNLLALEGLLRREGLELLKARSGPEALELLLVHDVALALLDVQMPGMDGFELAEFMRGTERTRRVPIIFLTAGSNDQQRRFRGYEAGAVDFLFKPIEPHILQSKAGIFFEFARQRDGLIRSAEEARAANRAKDDFLAALSHELRTPLTPVLMTATALESDLSLPAEVRQQLGMMRRNIELEARLIDDLLDITRISRGKLTIQPVAADVHQLLDHTVEMVRSDGLGKDVSVVFALEAARHHVMADPARLQQVFWNLVKNALKFTPSGGTVTIGTHNDAEERIVVVVKDTGIGIAAEALPHIFAAFEQGDVAGQHRYGGLGLGLAISQAIAAVHGGSIVAASEGSGHGATFTVTLATINAPATEPAKAAQPASARMLRLLLVEDNEATRQVLTRLLVRHGHQVVSAGTLQEALTAFQAGSFDVVVTDLGLPDGSGFELMREVQNRGRCHAIALSGYGMEQDLRQSREAGFFAHLVKPVRIEQLLQLIEQLPPC
ncbi:MAG: hybrid sensor histidine kinase/response regulator [Verrucomicrobiaceae bacterium]|nr:hybrid sensor histidine kinase/response regulator [Verrucomicrobiaceae bacterium]